MSFPPSKSKTYVAGETLTASDLNTSLSDAVNSNIPEDIDDYSASVGEMQTVVDPYPAASPSQATTLSGELERMRYQTKGMLGTTHWYEDAPITLTDILSWASYRRPQLVWVNATTVDVANNTATANETKIVFRDGTSRSVTEDTSSTHKYRRFIITATAEFTTGTEDSGLRSGESEAINTWYAIYAVKSTIDATKFVLVGSTTLPVQGSISTLNTNFGSNGWVYLGLIRNGDRSAVTGDILSFVQNGSKTAFTNVGAGAVTANYPGTNMVASANSSTLAYTYAAGTGSQQIPAVIGLVDWTTAATSPGGSFRIRAQTADTKFFEISNTPGLIIVTIKDVAATLGLQQTLSSSTSCDIVLSGFTDTALESSFAALD